MKFKLSFFALLLCTLFFACKKNDILNDETGTVSASGIAGKTIVNDFDFPSDHTFPNCTDIPSDAPFYINVGMFQENLNNYSILLEFEKNARYTGTAKPNSLYWDYCISYRQMNDSGDFGDCQWVHYNGDNLLINIPITYQDIKLSVNGCSQMGSTNYYFDFEHIIDATVFGFGDYENLYTEFDLNAAEGTTVNCQCSYFHCNRAYTLLLPRLSSPYYQ